MNANDVTKTLEDLTKDVPKAVKDAAYIAIGFGVLAFQKAQVQRREFEQQLAAQTGDFRSSVQRVANEVEERIVPLVTAVETSLDQLEERLPDPAREAFKTARSAAREAGETMRNRVANAA